MSTQASAPPTTTTSTTRRFFSPSKSRQELIGKTAIYVLLFAGAVVLMIPLFWMLSTSVKPKDQVYSYPIVWIPREIIWQNYPLVFQKIPFARYLTNSTFLSFFGILGNLLGSSLAAYGFARFRFPGPHLSFHRHAQHAHGAGVGYHDSHLHYF